MRVILDEVPGKVEEIQTLMEDAGLIVKLESVSKGGREGELTAAFEVKGDSNAFRRCRSEIIEMHEVRGVFRS